MLVHPFSSVRRRISRSGEECDFCGPRIRRFQPENEHLLNFPKYRFQSTLNREFKGDEKTFLPFLAHNPLDRSGSGDSWVPDTTNPTGCGSPEGSSDLHGVPLGSKFDEEPKTQTVRDVSVDLQTTSLPVSLWDYLSKRRIYFVHRLTQCYTVYSPRVH